MIQTKSIENDIEIKCLEFLNIDFFILFTPWTLENSR